MSSGERQLGVALRKPVGPVSLPVGELGELQKLQQSPDRSTSKDSSGLSQQGRVHITGGLEPQALGVPMGRAEPALPLFQSQGAGAMDASTAQSGAETAAKAGRSNSARVSARALAATGKRGSERSLEATRKQARLTGAPSPPRPYMT